LFLGPENIVCTFEDAACLFEDELGSEFRERWIVTKSSVKRWENTLNFRMYSLFQIVTETCFPVYTSEAVGNEALRGPHYSGGCSPTGDSGVRLT